ARGFESVPIRRRPAKRIRATEDGAAHLRTAAGNPGDAIDFQIEESSSTGRTVMFRRTVAPGLEIKLFETGEAKLLYEIADRNRERLRQWLPWVDQTRSAEDVRMFILRVLDQYHSNLGPQTGIWVNGVLSGTVGCHPIDWSNRNCSIGYWIDASQE